MENKDKPINPYRPIGDAWDDESNYGFMGLTKREYIATGILQSLVSGYSESSKVNDRYIPLTDYPELCKEAIELTKELLKQLES